MQQATPPVPKLPQRLLPGRDMLPNPDAMVATALGSTDGLSGAARWESCATHSRVALGRRVVCGRGWTAWSPACPASFPPRLSRTCQELPGGGQMAVRKDRRESRQGVKQVGGWEDKQMCHADAAA